MNPAGRVRERDGFTAKLSHLLNRVDRHVARPGDGDRTTFQTGALRFQHRIREKNRAVPCRFLAPAGTSPVQPLAGEDSCLPTILQPAVLPKEETDLPLPHANVTSRNVCFIANVSRQFGHESLTEVHHFPVRLTVWVKVRTAFAAPDSLSRERILEDLLKAQELDDVSVH